jgi:hypothetical protein
VISSKEQGNPFFFFADFGCATGKESVVKMKFWNKIAVAIIGLSALSAYSALGQNLPVAKPESVGLSSAKLDNFKRTLQAEVDNGHIPGAVVMINRRGKLV